MINDKDAKIDEREEYLNKSKTINQVAPKIKANLNDKAKIIPT